MAEEQPGSVVAGTETLSNIDVAQGTSSETEPPTDNNLVLPEEEEQLAELTKLVEATWTLEQRKALVSNTNERVFYIRYLRARKHVVSAAFEMLKATEEWKRTFQGIGVDNVTQDMCVNEIATRKVMYGGRDKRGDAVFYLISRRHFKKDVAEMERFIVWLFESNFRNRANDGMKVHLVIDMKGSGWANVDMAGTKFMLATAQNHFPEYLSRVSILNAPYFFPAVWKMIKPWMDPVVASKIHFLRAYEDLCETIERENILPGLLTGEEDKYHAGETVQEQAQALMVAAV